MFRDVVYGWDLHDQINDKVPFTDWHTGFPDCPNTTARSSASRRMNSVLSSQGMDVWTMPLLVPLVASPNSTSASSSTLVTPRRASV